MDKLIDMSRIGFVPDDDKTVPRDRPASASRANDAAANGCEKNVSPRPLDTLDLSTIPADEVPERPWIVPNMIPDRNVTDISGDGGLGKSLLGLQLAIAMTAKSEWIGMLPTHGDVLYVSCEDEPDEVMRRRNAILAGMNLKPSDIAKLHFLDLTNAEATEVAAMANGVLGLTELFHRLEATVARLKVKLVLIDTRADVFGGNELVRVQVRQFVRALRRLCIQYDMAIVMLSHPSVTGMNSGTGQQGSTAWGNSVRSRLYLTAPKPEADDEPNPDVRILSSKKANYGPRAVEMVLRWKDGMFVKDGESPAGLGRQIRALQDEVRFLELLDKRDKQGRTSNSSSGPNYAPKAFAKMDGEITAGKFRAAMERLFEKGEIKNEPYASKGKSSSFICITETGRRRIGPHF